MSSPLVKRIREDGDDSKSDGGRLAQVAEHAASVADAELLFGHAISARVRTNPECFWDVMGVGEDQ